MDIQEHEKKFLEKLLEYRNADPASYWPFRLIQVYAGATGYDADKLAKKLTDEELIMYHEKAEDCIMITDKGAAILTGS